MTLWQTSLTYQIWVWLCDVYEDSTLHRFLAAAGRWCNGQIEESRILRPLCREGIVARSWKDSFLCRMLSALVNLPGTLLHAWYKAWNLTFEDSFFARLAFDMGDSASIAQFWCIAALWCIPYERWNNAYSFMTGVLLLLLFYAGAMRTGRRLDVARIGFYPALMLAAVTLAVTFSYAPGLSARFLIYHVSAALLVVITVSAVRNGEDLKRLCAGAAVCVGATGAYGIVQRIQGVKVNPSYVDLKVNAGMPGRVFSIFDNPNTFAQVLLLLLPLVLALFLTAKRWQWTASTPLPIRRTPPPPAGCLFTRRPLRSSAVPPSPERASAPPPPRHTSGSSTCITTRLPLSTPTISIWRSGFRWACWASPVLWVPCCGTSKTPPGRSGITAPPWGGR